VVSDTKNRKYQILGRQEYGRNHNEFKHGRVHFMNKGILIPTLFFALVLIGGIAALILSKVCAVPQMSFIGFGVTFLLAVWLSVLNYLLFHRIVFKWFLLVNLLTIGSYFLLWDNGAILILACSVTFANVLIVLAIREVKKLSP
jgi:hypothetical protein